ncbi:centromere-associated protein E-like isoform X3, partial [Biomphalaria glabrata]
FKDHSCSKPPAVDCISEGEEEEGSNLSLTTEKRDIDIQTDMNTANGLDEIRKCAMDKLEISQDRKSMDLVKQEKCVQQNNDQPKLEEELLKDKLDELISKEKSLSRQRDSKTDIEKKVLESKARKLEEKLL